MDTKAILVELNVRWLRQALVVIEGLDDLAYGSSPPGFAPHRVGGHLRHILEFYQCFIDGTEPGIIDYDARQRNKAIEQSVRAATAAICGIIRFFETSLLCGEARVRVRMEDAPAAGCDLMESSISRELQILSSHTIHHFALIAMTLRLHGVEIDPEFGMAPSTLRYMADASKAA